MNNLSDNIFSLPLFDAFTNAPIILLPADINRAIAISVKINNVLKQWQVYLNALALSGFQHWLESRDNSLTINIDKCTILQPAFANLIEGVTNLEVGEFKVCLIATGCVTDEYVTLPRVIVDVPEFISHFYIVVEVLSEQQAASVYGFLSRQQLVKSLDIKSLQPNWDYQLSLSCFDNNIDNLLLYLRCLDIEAITLPAIPNNRVEMLLNIEKELATCLPELQNPEIELWEVLTWEQATVVLTNSQLVEWIYEAQQVIETRHLQIGNLIKIVTEPAINAGRWLWGELDEIAQQLAWELLPNFSHSLRQTRSPMEEFEAVVDQLQQQGLEIPISARAAFKDLSLAGVPLRMYAVTWHLLAESQNREWTLLVILGAPALDALPQNIKLRVSDHKEILSEQGLDAQAGNSYIFTRVLGTWDEKFLVSISLIDGVEITLPPFAFNLGSSMS